MAKKHPGLSPEHQAFIAEQKLFFVGTAADEGRINVSPKGFESLHIESPNRVIWMNITGSGNETASHLQNNSRMTIMFCAFDGRPIILRLYGQARAVHAGDAEWERFSSLFPDAISARQYVDFEIDLVLSSCGFGVPFYDYKNDRDNMDNWLSNKSREDIEEYWARKNQLSLDGEETHILAKSNAGPTKS